MFDNEPSYEEYLKFQNPYVIGGSGGLGCFGCDNDNFSESSQRESYDYIDNNGQNGDDIINTRNNIISNVDDSNSSQENRNFNIINEDFDPNKNKLTTHTTETIAGKTIITSCSLIDKKCIQMGIRRVLNYENIKSLSLLGRKRPRRTNKEIENNKKNKDPPKPKVKKKGRCKTNQSCHSQNENSTHDKFSQDNITKGLNCQLINSSRNWMNNSFLNSSGNFINFDKKKKINNHNENIFLKIDPNIITNNITKKDTLENLKKPLKEIFSYSISKKYKLQQKDINKILIDKILKENKQDFVIYILNMSFEDLLNYYNGIITDETIINHFKGKYDEKLIRQFIKNFQKIDCWIEEIAEKEKDPKLRDDYIERIKIISLNYKQIYEAKHNRTKKEKKNDNNK